MVDEAVITLVQAYLAKLADAGIPVDRGIIFGSYARGEQRWESDIDVLVISPLFDTQGGRDAVSKLWVLARQVDVRIEPIAVGVREYETETWKPIFVMARREGISVYAPAHADAQVAADARVSYPK